MGLYRYNPESPLTRWQQEKVYALCGERGPVAMRVRLGIGQERPGDKALLKHLEREIDWYQMKEAKPGLDHLRACNRKLKRFLRKVTRLVAAAESKRGSE